MNSSEKTTRIEFVSGSLPTKITGIVFWGTLLVGLLIALIMLHGKERELASLQTSDMLLVERAVEDILDNQSESPILQNNHIALENSIQSIQHQLHFEAIELSSQGDFLQVGLKGENPKIIVRTLRIRPRHGEDEPPAVIMTAYFPNLQETVSNYRKNILITIGLMIIVYALILQYIFHILLSRPFAGMLKTAKNFAEGNSSSRFDETNRDEFGFLSKFINRALDAIEVHEKEMNETLARLTDSEAELFSEKERAEVTLQSIAEAVITTNSSGEVEYLNPVAERITGLANANARGLPITSVFTLVQENSEKIILNPVYECLKSNCVETLISHSALRRNDGVIIAIEASAAPMHNDLGEVIGAVMVCQDVTQARKFAHQLSFQAGHDSLTGLYNRREFDNKLRELLEHSKSNGSQNVLLYLDLDQFKVVNDTCGHTAGDRLLLQLSVLLGQKVRKNDVLARLGGDEFGVLLVGCDIDYGKKIAEVFLQLISDFRFVWDDKIFQVGVSIGLVPVTAATESSAEVMSAADAACYLAKDKGRNRIELYQGHDGRGKKYGEMQWVPRIHKAIEENKLCLYYQNIVKLSSDNQVDYAEILLRMEDESGTIVPPMAFIPAAERYNIMPMIDRWVIKNTLEWMKAHPLGNNNRPQHFAINISGQSLGDEQFLGYLLNQLELTGVAPEQVCLEITETTAIANIGNAITFITALKSKGCRFSLDDFGSGMSSYSYLKNLDVDSLKIDGAFIKDMVHTPVDLAMVESINHIGHVMGLQTIAEFVEDEATLKKLRDIGVNYAQGYGIHVPERLS
jgi:diguanylate cyclase (GGDEF)-like protein/PAS domain S-box-containing protein